MIARAFALWLVLPAAALAAPILTSAVQWTPGTSPCDGACTLPWAVKQMVEAGHLPAPVAARFLAGEAQTRESVARPGDFFVNMTFAKDGVPGFDPRTYQLSDGTRHHVTDELVVTYEGVTYRLANLRTCQNWALRPPTTETKLASIGPAWADPVQKFEAMLGPSFGLPGGPTYPLLVKKPKEKKEKEQTPPAIPLPGAVWSLLTGLAGLLYVGRKR